MIKLEKITSIYGPPGSGKTVLAIQSLVPFLKENKMVLYIDTEGTLSLEKIKDISNISIENLLILRVKNFKDQQLKINELKNIKNISLVIVDSINNHYRSLAKSKPDLANGMLNSQLRILKNMNIPILILNQVYTDLKTKENKISGGVLIKSFSDNLIELQKDPVRKIIYKNNKEELIKITDKGIEKI